MIRYRSGLMVAWRLGFEQYLQQLAELEVKERHERKILRLRKISQLPAEKPSPRCSSSGCWVPVRRTLRTLCEGHPTS